MKTSRLMIPLTVALSIFTHALLAQTVPVVTSQPGSAVAVAGSAAMFTVGASGTGLLSYQWFFNGAPAGINGVITTVAGSSFGDGGRATNASLYDPSAAAVDTAGNLYIADSTDERIRKVDINGIITTVAGNGAYGYSGNGGPATNASLGVPTWVAVDAAGNLFIADFGNNVIRKVGTNGIITTVAGNKTAGYSGDGGAATNASLDDPCSVVLDNAGNLFISDYGNDVVREVGIDGIITTVAGNGTAGYSGDGGTATNAELDELAGVTVDATGNLFIADSGNNVIRKVGTNGIITTLAGNGSEGFSGDGGAATNASLWGPGGVAVDAAGDVLFADEANQRVRKVGTNGIITTVAGNGTKGYSGDGGVATKASLLYPSSVVVDTMGNLFINDSGNYRIRKVGTNNIISTVAGDGYDEFAGDGGPAANATLYNPESVAADAAGHLFIVDSGNDRIRKVGTNGIITTLAGDGTDGFSGDGAAATKASLSGPAGLALDVAGNLYFADAGNDRVRKVGTNGIITTVAGNGGGSGIGDGGLATKATLSSPIGVAVDAARNLYIADEYNNRIRKVGTNGIISTVAGSGIAAFSGDGGVATNASLWYPSGVAVDAAGNLYIADSYNNRIRKVGTNGIITTLAGNGPSGRIGGYSGDGGAATNADLSYPSGVAVDAAGNLYLADYGSQHIRKVGTNGIITRFAGNGTEGFSGDGGQATNASLYGPFAVALDATGNLLIADDRNNRIRRVTVSDLSLASGGASIEISNASAGNVGGYSVVVSDAYGSVTSSVANLSLVAGQFTGVAMTNGTVSLDFQGVAGRSYVLLYTSNLSPPVTWSPLSTNTADGSGNVTAVDPDATGVSGKFYTISTH
jgi:trimeric autotransporter adhesin